MPAIGRPLTNSQNSLQNVQMPAKKNDDAQTSNHVDQSLLEKASGQSFARKLKTADAESHNKVGKDDFLKLLTHQLQNQDPTSPMDQNKFAADLAQFSQLEQLSNLNQKFEGMNTNAATEKKALSASFIGQMVVTDGTSLSLAEDGASKDIIFNLEKKANKLAIRILDSQGNIAQEINQENVMPGSQTVVWDGKALDGYPAPKGEYTLSLVAWDENSTSIPVKTQVSGIVDSVTFDGDEPVLSVGNKKVYLRDVSGFYSADQKQAQLDGVKKYQEGLSAIK